MINGLHQYSTESLIKELEKRELAKLEKLKSEIPKIQEDFRVQCKAFAELMEWLDRDMEKAKDSFSNTDHLDLTQNFRVTEDWFKK